MLAIAADQDVSGLTHLWMTNLSRSGYNPTLGWLGGVIVLAVTVTGNWAWYQHFDSKQPNP